MKVSIIGGGGLVGSCAGFALQATGAASEIAMLDVNKDLALGQALDLMHGGPSTSDQVISAGGYEHIADSDVICITAGLRRKPDESRLDLINRNTELFLSILGEVSKAKLKSSAVVLVVSNPVDVLTYLAAERLGLPTSQVLGLGTQLDTIRFRSLLAAHLGTPPKQTSALILGEHGDSMVPIWSGATVAGLPLDKYPNWSHQIGTQIFERTKKSGAEMLKTKGGAGFAVGVAIADVIDSVILDKNLLLPVSSVLRGEVYGLRDVALSVPTKVGRGGRKAVLEIDLWPKELQGLKASERSLKETLALVKK
ncbi:MAG: lactate/malate dehydrogenase family protein [Planctomycetaceae bacterium]|nr:lactate/malate dehydrogenase family protein [Planctomycetaceae bacterium]